MKEQDQSADWFRLFQDGDEKAFDQLFRLYYPPARFFANIILNCHPDAPQIASDTMFKIWEKRYVNNENFETEAHLEAFIYKVTRNGCLMHLRSEGRYRKFLGQLSYLSEDSVPGPDVARIHAEIMCEVSKEIQNLPAPSRRIIELFYREGKKRPEIAREMALPAGLISQKKLRALEFLRSRIFHVGKVAFLVLLSVAIFLKKI